MVDIYLNALRLYIYLELFTDPGAGSCFGIYKINWIKMEKKKSVSRKFVYTLQTFRGFCQVRFLQIQQGNNFLPTSKHRQAEVRRFLGICLFDCFNYRSNFVIQ